MYDSHIGAFKLNEVATFIGVLEFRPRSGTEDQHMKESEDELHTNIPNEHMLPHLHVITFRRNNSLNNNPVLALNDASEDIVKSEKDLLTNSRDKLIAIFKLLLNNDQIAAEYLLLSLISRVHTRKDAFILGNLSINLAGVGMSFLQTHYIKEIIKSITPMTLYLPLTLDVLENKRFAPSKNYDTNLLEGGVL